MLLFVQACREGWRAAVLILLGVGLQTTSDFLLTLFHSQKWKQLSRLQRSVILFVFAFLAVCGVITYANMTEPWKSESSCFGCANTVQC